MAMPNCINNVKVEGKDTGDRPFTCKISEADLRLAASTSNYYTMM